MIYSHLFLTHPVIRLHHLHFRGNSTPGHMKGSRFGKPYPLACTMAMLLLNKSLLAEVLEFLYTKNTVRVSTKYHRDWFGSISTLNGGVFARWWLAAGEGGEASEAWLGGLPKYNDKRFCCLTDATYLFEGIQGLESFGLDLLLELPKR